jgi:hypothetical protein
MTPAAPRLSQCLAEIVGCRLPRDARGWFETGVSEARDPDRFRLAFDEAPRRLGRVFVTLDGPERGRLEAAGLAGGLDGWRLDETARATLLLEAVDSLAPAALDRLVETTWRRGDSLVARAVLRTLPLLPAPERFLGVALEGARSSLQLVFEAIACANPYPAAHFHEVHFNDLALKAVAADLRPDRIVGLHARMNPELLRLVRAHVAFRRAAGRRVPAALGRFAAGPGAAA